MRELIEILARPDLLNLAPYSSARSLNTQGSVFLDANEAPVAPALFSSSTPFLNRYPEPQPVLLLERFSKLYQVPSSKLLIGRGSDEAIDLLVRGFCRAGIDKILTCPPTYGMYEMSAKIQGAQTVHVPLISTSEDELLLDEVGIAQAIKREKNLKLIFICSPNNPTGTPFSTETITRICKLASRTSFVVVDEAYLEFQTSDSILASLKSLPNLVVLRTLSKAWALAGVRCGVAIADEAVIELLQKIRPPYPLSTPAIQAILDGTSSIQQERLTKRVQSIRTERDSLIARLKKLETVEKIFPSSTNFILVKFKNSGRIFSNLRAKGIILRDRSTELGLENCIRITVGTEEENTTLLQALGEALEEACS